MTRARASPTYTTARTCRDLAIFLALILFGLLLAFFIGIQVPGTG